MPGKEIKGRSKRAMYSNGKLVGKQAKLDVAEPKGVLNSADFKALGKAGSKAKTMDRKTAMAGGMMRKKVMGGGSMMRMEKSMGGGLYENIKKKKDRIAAGSGEKMRKVGAKGAPTAQNFKDAAKTAKKA
jgi:hypothetical protein